MSSLQGADALRARLKALRQNVFKPAGKDWADETARIARSMVPNRDTRWSKGRLHDSIKRKSATQRKAIVVAHYSAYFVDSGVKPHYLTPRKSTVARRAKQGRTIFARAARKMHPGYRARPFRAKAAHDALRRYPIKDKVIAAWNEAA